MIAMPFSGGQDSFMNLLLQIIKEPDPIHLFYFRMKTKASLVEEDYIKGLIPRMLDATNFKDVRLHFVDALDLRGVGQEPNPFVPFRNYYFAQYLMGLGFRRILFSFSADDALFYDTSDTFLAEIESMAIDNLGHPVSAYTLTRTMCRIDYMRFLLEKYEHPSDMLKLYREDTYSCSESRPCRACTSCFIREIGEMWLEDELDRIGRPHYMQSRAIKSKEGFLKHWQGHTTLRDFYKRVMTNAFADPVARDQYWKFLEGFESGALLKGIAF